MLTNVAEEVYEQV